MLSLEAEIYIERGVGEYGRGVCKVEKGRGVCKVEIELFHLNIVAVMQKQCVKHHFQT